MSYVVVYVTYVQDGYERHSKVVDDLEEAARVIEKLVGFGYGCRTEAQLFELGRELPLSFEDVYDQPPPPKKGVKVTIGATPLKKGRK